MRARRVAVTRRGVRRLQIMVPSLVIALALIPSPAQAHGPTAPVGINYLAVVKSGPTGLVAAVVDGDQSMWLNVPPAMTLDVIDYQGAPYVRFAASGVYVNTHSEMYYLNQPTQVAEPVHIGPQSRPVWVKASSGHSYSWHDGRLQALATVKLAPGARFAGVWRIPVRVDGQSEALSGDLLYRPAPSLVWFWPIVVLLACVLALRRARSPVLSRWLTRTLGLLGLLAASLAGIGLELHGRPGVGPFQYALVGVGLAVAVAALIRIALGRARLPLFFVIGTAALGAGFALLPALLNGFALVALPTFLARADTALCLGCGLSLLVLGLWELWDLWDRAPTLDVDFAGRSASADPRSG